MAYGKSRTIAGITPPHPTLSLLGGISANLALFVILNGAERSEESRFFRRFSITCEILRCAQNDKKALC